MICNNLSFFGGNFFLKFFKIISLIRYLKDFYNRSDFFTGVIDSGPVGELECYLYFQYRWELTGFVYNSSCITKI